ncbi:MAG: ABC transporter ATP-binding protein [Candidatus Omnitrophica bacterium]|nr:ABC transporter ATP-binding protein [Candidatus Omnitrophota bacterium]
MNAIQISKLSKFYGKTQALHEISLAVPAGDFFGFLGPNGAGKTTTIHAMTGLANFQGGDIKVFGNDVIHDYRKTRALIGFVPQEFNFDPYLSAEQILVFEAGYFGLPKKIAKARAAELLEEFELSGHRHLDYRKLSGGMKRRLLIARGLIHQPKVLILDEPTAGVDLELRLKLWDFLKRLNEEGVTIFLTTHYIEEAERLCKRIGVIHHGRMIALDTTAALIDQLGSHVITLRLDRSFEVVPEPILRFGVELVKQGGNMIRFRKDDERISDLFKTIHAQGIGITGIETEKTSLEEIFLEMTKST